MEDISMKQSNAALSGMRIVQEASSGTRLHKNMESGSSKANDTRKKIDSSPRHVKGLVHQANLKAGTYNGKITFQLEKDGQPPKILVLDKESGKIIRKIPSDELESINSQMEKFIGTIFNGRV